MIFTTDADLLREFPASFTNDARAIVRQAINSFRKNASDAKRKTLETYGIVVDQDDRIDHFGEWEQSDFSKQE